MADISKCFGMNCTKKQSCYRYTAEASQYQSYIDFEPEIVNDEETCAFYISNDNE